MTFDISMFKFPNGFFETNKFEEAKHQKIVQILLQSPNPVINTKILAPELVGDQSKMVVKQFFTHVSKLDGVGPC